MKVKWLGHACFLITSDNGLKIITDPYKYLGLGLKYDPIDAEAEIVTKSHGHGDHNAIDEVDGDPTIVEKTGVVQVKGIDITGIACYHDEVKGAQRGENIIYCFNVDDIRLCHLGDLGHMLSDEQLTGIGGVDILLIPIGGKFTIDPTDASRVCNQIVPRVVIPMHVKTEKCDIVPFTADDFAKGKSNVKRVNGSEIEFSRDALPADTEIVILKHGR